MNTWLDALKDIEQQMDKVERALEKIPTDTDTLVPIINRYNRLKVILYERKCQFLKTIFDSILMLGGAENFHEANHQIHRMMRPDVNRKLTTDDSAKVIELVKTETSRSYYSNCSWLIKIRVVSRLKELSKKLEADEFEKVVTEFRQAFPTFK